MFKKLSYSLPCYLIYQKRNKPSLFFRVTVSEREITAKQNKKQKNPQAFIHIDLIGQRKIKKKKKIYGQVICRWLPQPTNSNTQRNIIEIMSTYLCLSKLRFKFVTSKHTC